MIGGGGPGNSLTCQPLIRRSKSAAKDRDVSDEGSLGIAITAVATTVGSRVQMKTSESSEWVDVNGRDLRRAAAVVLPGGTGARIRVIAAPEYQGAITCTSCPDRPQTSGTCIPCAVNRSVASLTFAAWDGTDGSIPGQAANAAYVAGGAFSAATKTVKFEVIPEEVDDLAPNGTQFNVAFAVRDNSGNLNASTHNVTIVDTTPPVIALRGNSSLLVEGGVPYVEPGVTALDSRDLDYPANTSRILSLERRDTLRCSNPNADPCVQSCIYQPFTTSFQQVPNRVLNMSDAVGTQFRVTYEVSDLSGHTATVTRTLEIVDRTAPVVFPPTSTTYTVTQLEYTNGIRYPGSASSAGCLDPLSHYRGNETGLFGCYSAIDSVEGDLTCRTNVTVFKLPPDDDWTRSNSQFSAAFIFNSTCIARTNVTSSSLDLNCYSPARLDIRGPTRSALADTQVFPIITPGGPRPGNAADALLSWAVLGTRYDSPVDLDWV